MDILNNIRYGVELERARMDDNGLNESPSWMNSILGTISNATQEGVDKKRTAITSAADKRQYGDLYTSTTGKAWRDGMSGATALNEINKYNETKTDQKDTKNFERSLVPLTKQLAASALESKENRILQSEQYRTSLQSQQNQFAHTSEQNALTRRHDMERADKRDTLSLQMQVMQNDLSEKRMDYDRETRRLDKRSEAIAQLMSGLGALGSVFV